MNKYFLLLLTFFLTTLAPAASELQAKSEITQTIHRFMQRIDEKKFDEVEQMFTKEATNTAVFGGQPQETKTAHAIVEGWKQGLSPVKSIHHQVSNFIIQVQGAKASMTFYGIATWFRPENSNPVTWFVGDYECDLVKIAKEWKISRLKYNNKFVNPPFPKS